MPKITDVSSCSATPDWMGLNVWLNLSGLSFLICEMGLVKAWAPRLGCWVGFESWFCLLGRFSHFSLPQFSHL